MSPPDSNPSKRSLSELPEASGQADALGASPSCHSDSGGSLSLPLALRLRTVVDERLAGGGPLLYELNGLLSEAAEAIELLAARVVELEYERR
jgi:hypothetical protein